MVVLKLGDCIAGVEIKNSLAGHFIAIHLQNSL
jgi:hypothetical protein